MGASEYLKNLKTEFLRLFVRNANGQLSLKESMYLFDLRDKLARLDGETQMSKIFNLIVKNS